MNAFEQAAETLCATEFLTNMFFEAMARMDVPFMEALTADLEATTEQILHLESCLELEGVG